MDSWFGEVALPAVISSPFRESSDSQHENMLWASQHVALGLSSDELNLSAIETTEFTTATEIANPKGKKVKVGSTMGICR